jgi:hypothetical protein
MIACGGHGRDVFVRQPSSTTMALLRSALTQRPFRPSPRASMRVIPIPVLKDNYSYLILDDIAKEAAAVDPYTPSKVKEVADQLGVRVVAGITTHHHDDHSGGNRVRSLQSFLFSITTNTLTLHFRRAPQRRNSCVVTVGFSHFPRTLTC